MTTLLNTTSVADITDPDDLTITVESASAIVGATDVGAVNGASLNDSQNGVIVGGTDSELGENELLVYIV